MHLKIPHWPSPSLKLKGPLRTKAKLACFIGYWPKLVVKCECTVRQCRQGYLHCTPTEVEMYTSYKLVVFVCASHKEDNPTIRLKSIQSECDDLATNSVFWLERADVICICSPHPTISATICFSHSDIFHKASPYYITSNETTRSTLHS